MSTAKISATELVRNLSGIIDQVRISRTSMTITKGNQDVARLVPILSSHMSLADLNQLLKADRLSREEKKSFQKDIETLAQQAVLPDSPWK